jgi:hypothetical protein
MMTEKAIVAAKKTGPVFLTLVYLDKNIERIKSGRLTRMDAIRALQEKGVSGATAAGTLLRWSRANDIEWSKKPSAAASRAKKTSN